MSVIDPEHLLEQADKLITPPNNGAPRQTDLRRAISNAYYAVFHTVLTEVADEIVGKTRRAKPQYALVYRSIAHSSLRTLCLAAKEKSLAEKYAKYAPRGEFSDEIRAFATAFLDLFEKRHLADYDPLFKAKKSDVILHVATARAAIAKLKKSKPDIRKAFCTLLVFSPR
jgi:uncharacterized protein (UPF0332 family)